MSRVLVTGAGGQLGAYLLAELAGQNIDTVAWSGTRTGTLSGVMLRPTDLRDADAVTAALREAAPSIVIHAAALSRIDECFRYPDEARRVNFESTKLLADWCGRRGTRLTYLSTDLVFDGRKGAYREEDPPSPVSVYGRTKWEGELPVSACPRSVVIRSSLLFGPSLVGRKGFFDAQLDALRSGVSMSLFDDEWRTPLGLAAAARFVRVIVASDFEGRLHMGGPERMSRWDMGARLAAALGLDVSVFRRVGQAEVPMSEPRPPDVSLDCSRLRREFPDLPWPNWEESLREMHVIRGS